MNRDGYMTEEKPESKGVKQVFSPEDIERLRTGTTASRAEIAAKVGWSIDNYPLNKEEFALAIQVVALLLGDSSVQVRMALAETLKESERTPRELLFKLATDRDGQVAYPVLKNNRQFLDHELIDIIQETQELIRLMAIAEREKLSAIVSGALIDKAIETLVETVILNPGAEIAEDDLKRVSDQYYESEPVLKAMMRRDPIPYDAVNRMVANASKAVKGKLLVKSIIDEDSADAVQFSTDILLDDLSEIRKLGSNPTTSQSVELASTMNIRGHMTPQLQTMLLMLGYTEAFASCLAKQVRKDLPEVIEQLQSGRDGFNEIFKLSRLPAGTLELLATLYEAASGFRVRGLEPGTRTFLECLGPWLDDAAARRVLYVESLARKLYVTLLEHL